jgi:type I restriction enzyme R subunit
LFAELGWHTVSAGEEIFGANGTFGLEKPGEVILVPRLRRALEKLNPTLPPEAIAAAVDELTRDRSAMLLEQANREVYHLLTRDDRLAPVAEDIVRHFLGAVSSARPWSCP